MTPKEMKECEMRILKAKASKSELEFKIMEREEEMERIRAHIKLQDEIIHENETKLGGLNG